MNATMMVPSMRRGFALLLLAVLVCGIGQSGPAEAAISKAATGIRFSYVDASATSVTWVGDFNGWNTTANPMVKDPAGTWSITLPLPAGEHMYKFVVDNNYIADPDNTKTKGEYGNSVVMIGADGAPSGAAARAPAVATGGDANPARGAGEIQANTAYSAKLEFHGRGIGLYESFLSRAHDRFELRRPRLDFELDTGIRISDVLAGRWLLRINSEQPQTEFFRTRLIFDRGNLTFRKNNVEVFGYDNEAAGTWDDALHLVGDVGIYGYDYGYERQGFRIRPSFGGFEGELHYADNFRAGGTTYPGTPEFVITPFLAGLATEPDGAGGYRLAAETAVTNGGVNASDANEDMLALRLRRAVGPVHVGLLGRMDRGFDLGASTFAFAAGPDRVRWLLGQYESEWYGYGAEVRWPTGVRGLELFGEGLFGRKVADMTSAQIDEFQVTVDDTGAVVGQTLLSSTPGAMNESVTLDRSRRLALGGTWSGELVGGPSAVTATLTHQDDDDRMTFEDLRAADTGRRSTNAVRVRWDQGWGALLPRAVSTIVDVEWQGFDYRAGDPWDAQFWFSQRNFWLEQFGDKVSPDRIVMLGGRDVWTLRPELRVPILPAKNFAFEYAGRIHTHGLSTRPKFIESFFRLGYDLSPSLRAQADTRWVKYDDPVLTLHSGYVDHFAELAYTFAAGVQVALSYGVDPWVLDRATNAYAYRGRDDALTAEGVGSAGARTAFLDQGSIIAAAEKAMRDQRRIAVEAIVRF